MDRRNFIKSSAVAGGVIMSPFNILGQDKKLNVGIVGTGWWATDMILPALMQSGQYNIIGICDVDSAAMDKYETKLAGYSVTNVKRFKNYQDLYKMNGLDVVVLATPIHWHALQVIDASKKGLHLFMEKPIFYDIREGQAMNQAVQESGIMVQVDFEKLQFKPYQEVAQYIKEGNIGEVKQVDAQIHFGSGDIVEKDIPSTLDFDLWCGPAPVTKYLCKPDSNVIEWRRISTYCPGHLYDWGIHHINSIRRIMGLGMPNSVMAMGGMASYEVTDNPDYASAHFDFDGLPVRWNHRSWGSVSFSNETNNGIFFYGEKGTIFVGDGGWSVIPRGRDAQRQDFGCPNDRVDTIGAIELQLRELTAAINKKSDSGITAPLDDSSQTTVAVNLANISYRTEQKIYFNASDYSIKGDAKAQAMLKREYRKPFEHPFKG
ncbi:MAG: Gfo/Idh/MocA family oxidoreductase [Bacteroidetes bacterium]|nr:Gfo/Idh/MocA family oxidoreductase [Bacteroidota bacterium]